MHIFRTPIRDIIQHFNALNYMSLEMEKEDSVTDNRTDSVPTFMKVSWLGHKFNGGHTRITQTYTVIRLFHTHAFFL
jgi:hypothetical protein